MILILVVLRYERHAITNFLSQQWFNLKTIELFPVGKITEKVCKSVFLTI